MKNRLHAIAGVLSLILLSACGGGGGGDNNPNNAKTSATGGDITTPESPSPKPPLVLTHGNYSATFTPGAATADIRQSSDAAMDIDVALTGTYTGPVYVSIADIDGVTTNNPVITLGNDARTYHLRINVWPNLAAGRHTGTLQVRFCKDYQCNTLHPGSPWPLPYDINVSAEVKRLSALSTIPSLGDWSTYQGNARHTGYVPVSLDASRFSTRWVWNGPRIIYDGRTLSYALNPVAISDGVVYVTTRTANFAPGDQSGHVVALREEDGTELWHTNLGPVHNTNPPGISNSHVFLATIGAYGGGSMWTLDRTSGAVKHQTSFGAQWESYYAPTVVDGQAYTNGGGSGGMLRFDGGSGTATWFTGLAQIDEWTPAVEGGHAYAYLHNAGCCLYGNGLFVLNTSTGTVEGSLSDDDSGDQFGGYSMYGAPVMPSSERLMAINGRPFSGQNRLTMFDLNGGASPSIAWKIMGYFPNTPAVAKGVVYVAQSGPFRVEARQESDGKLLWTWVEPGMGTTMNTAPSLDDLPVGAIVVTDTHLFVSSRSTVYAVNLNSRKSEWSYPRAGNLALSAQGVLYILPARPSFDGSYSDGRLVAVNLR